MFGGAECSGTRIPWIGAGFACIADVSVTSRFNHELGPSLEPNDGTAFRTLTFAGSCGSAMHDVHFKRLTSQCGFKKLGIIIGPMPSISRNAAK